MSESTEVAPRELHGAGIVSGAPFFPPTDWAPLEQARQRHERALAELRDARGEESRIAGRQRTEQREALKAAAGRVLDGEPATDPAAAEDARRREMETIGVRIRAAYAAQTQAVLEGLRLIEAHPEWASEVAERREAAEAEAADLLAQAQAAKLRAHAEGHLEKWLGEAATRTSPQPFREAGPPPPAPATVAEVFRGVAA